eukprot:Rmarinus@m.15871
MVQLTEYRVFLPFELKECYRGYVYAVTRRCKEESSPDGSAAILKCDPVTRGDQEGVYTEKELILGSRLPNQIRSIVKSTNVRIVEKSWNFFPYVKTIYECEQLGEKFRILMDSVFIENDSGEQENALSCRPDLLPSRQVKVIDLATCTPESSTSELDPAKMNSSQFPSRFPLSPTWRTDGNTPVTCLYRLVYVECNIFGLQRSLERNVQRYIVEEQTVQTLLSMMKWADEWHGMSANDILNFVSNSQMFLDIVSEQARERVEASQVQRRRSRIGSYLGIQGSLKEILNYWAAPQHLKLALIEEGRVTPDDPALQSPRARRPSETRERSNSGRMSLPPTIDDLDVPDVKSNRAELARRVSSADPLAEEAVVRERMKAGLHAVIRIQSWYRGRKVRGSIGSIRVAVRAKEERRQRAVAKMQAAVRGFMVRKVLMRSQKPFALVVRLESADDLESQSVTGKVDAYVVVAVFNKDGTQKAGFSYTSPVAHGHSPTWANETINFAAVNRFHTLVFNVMDSQVMLADQCLGQGSISVGTILDSDEHDFALKLSLPSFDLPSSPIDGKKRRKSGILGRRLSHGNKVSGTLRISAKLGAGYNPSQSIHRSVWGPNGATARNTAEGARTRTTGVL